MRKLLILLTLGAGCVLAATNGTTPVTANRITRAAGAPSAGTCNTAASVGKVYIRTDAAAASSTFYVCANTAAMTYGWELGGGGGGNPISGATATAIVTAASATTLQTPSATATLDSSGNIVTPGTITTGSGGSTAGAVDMAAGTSASIAANSFGIGAPSTMTTSVRLESPNAVPVAHSLMVLGAPTSNKATWAYKAVPDCTDTGGNHLNFTQSTDAFSCGTSGSGGGTAFSTGIGNWCPWGCQYDNQTSDALGANNTLSCQEFTPFASLNLGIVASQQATNDAGKHFAFAIYSADGNTLIATSSTINSAANTNFAATFSGLTLTGATTYNLCISSDSNNVISFYRSGNAHIPIFWNTISGAPRVYTAANNAAWSGTTPNFPSTIGARTAATPGPLILMLAD